jgi:hypothetical protein
MDYPQWRGGAVDFHPHFRTDKCTHLYHCAGQADIAEYLAVRPSQMFGIADIGEVKMLYGLFEGKNRVYAGDTAPAD